jgi:hypothetical protein
VEQNPTPALYLPFQLDLKGVPLAQNEGVDVFLAGLWAWGSTEQVVDLAWGALF